jgi:hypothetical protein
VQGAQLATTGKRYRLFEGRRPGQIYTSRRASCRSRPE